MTLIKYQSPLQGLGKGPHGGLSLHVCLLLANCADERGLIDRQKDRRTDRQKDRQRDILTDRQTD